MWCRIILYVCIYVCIDLCIDVLIEESSYWKYHFPSPSDLFSRNYLFVIYKYKVIYIYIYILNTHLSIFIPTHIDIHNISYPIFFLSWSLKNMYQQQNCPTNSTLWCRLRWLVPLLEQWFWCPFFGRSMPFGVPPSQRITMSWRWET